MLKSSNSVRKAPVAGRDGVFKIVELLMYWGYGHPETIGEAMSTLVLAGLTREGKRGMHRKKVDMAAEILARRLVLVCENPECLLEAGRTLPYRLPLPAQVRTGCEICNGRQNQRSFRGLISALSEAGLNRLLIVGGSPASREDIASLVNAHGSGVTVRFVDGTSSRNGRMAKADLEWADLVIIWVGELRHKVSKLYRRADRSAVVNNHGVAMLAKEVASQIKQWAV